MNTVIPTTVTSIQSFAFRGHDRLRSVTIPNSITSIGSAVFCDARPIHIFSQIEEPFKIDGEASGYYSATFDFGERTTLFIPAGTKAKYEATEGWKDFSNIVDGNDWFSANTKEGVEMVFVKQDESPKTCEAAFVHESTSGVLTIPEEINGYTVTSIMHDSFGLRYNLSSVVIPNSVVTIGNYAFNACKGLQSVSLGSSVEVIGSNAFRLCSNLGSITLPGSVKSIGEYAFSSCTNLTKVVSNISEPFAINNNVFGKWNAETKTYDGKNSATLYVPVGTKALYEATEGWNVFQDIVEMVSLDPIEGETTVTTEGLGNENLTDNVVDDVYYNVGSEGYDAADGSIVISQTTNMGQIGNAVPGSEDVRNNFTGLILKVAAGKGTIKVNVKTTGNAQLVVQVGNGTPMIASKTEQGDVVVSYDVAEDTYVYIYAIIGSSAARATRAASADAVRIYGITVMPDAAGITTGITTIELSPSATDHYYTTDGRRMEGAPTKKGLYIVNGRKVITK